jgi:hypothetical protein
VSENSWRRILFIPASTWAEQVIDRRWGRASTEYLFVQPALSGHTRLRAARIDGSGRIVGIGEGRHNGAR